MSSEKNAQGLYEVVVDELTYEFEKWGAEESYDVLLDLVKLCGEPLGLLVGTFFGKGEIDEDINPDVFGVVFRGLTAGIGDKALVKTITKKLVANSVLCNGQKVTFNTHYKDRLDHMFRVLWAALEVQYGNFTSAVLALVRARKPPVDTNLAPAT